MQAFPWKSWEEEFCYARACGFDIIEWLFEADDYQQNLIWTKTGLQKIRREIVASGVQVRSVCADYFMAHPFYRVTEKERIQSVTVLKKLIIRAARLGIGVILL